MALESTHPDFDELSDDYTTMRDLYKGERAVKNKGETYLPATQGMQLDGMAAGQPGKKAYDAYKMRAVFHDFVRMAVEAYIGLLYMKPPNIELPARMEYMRENATAHGESLELLLRRINEEQLVTGRLGLMLDLPQNPDPSNPTPFVELYIAEAIRNWDDDQANEGEAKLNLVVLDESGPVRDSDFNWTTRKKYRVLQLGVLEVNEAPGSAQYLYGTFENANGKTATYDPNSMQAPLLRGAALEEVPFVFVNTKDIVPSPDEPPLIGLGRLTLAIYRGEADYRQNLFMQSQDTLVIIGGRRKTVTEGEAGSDGTVRVGAGSMIETEVGGDAKYIGVTANGLSEQRSALENDSKRAESRAGQLINSGSAGNVESGVALQTRIGAQTATLNQIAQTGAAALEKVLRICAKWLGEDPEKVVVTPNLEFADIELTGDDLVKLMTARTMGAPLSKQSIHGLLRERGLTKMEFDEEMSTIEDEDGDAGGTAGTGEPGMLGDGTGDAGAAGTGTGDGGTGDGGQGAE